MQYSWVELTLTAEYFPNHVQAYSMVETFNYV